MIIVGDFNVTVSWISRLPPQKNQQRNFSVKPAPLTECT
jgi:hypothetical protein